MKILLIPLCFFMLSACSQPSRIREETRRNEYREAQQNLNVRCRHSFTDPSLDVIRNKVALGSLDDTTLEMLTDQSKPTDEEKVAIQKWVWLRSYCSREQTALYRRSSAPEHVITLDQVFSDRVLFLITDIYKGSLTYGEFNKRRKELASERRAKFSEMQRMDRQHAEQMAIEERKAKAQQDAADAAWFDAITAPARNPVPQPIYLPRIR
jgi:hypothetical protein